MKKYLSLLLIGASFAAPAGTAMAADVIEAPMVVETPEPVHVASANGWYIRGDIGYAMNGSLGAEYVTYGVPGGSNVLNGKLDDGFAGGVGVGYQITDYLRGELSTDYFASSEFSGSTIGGPCLIGGAGIASCVSSDSDSYTALSLMANAYVDLGTFNRITPYVGAGVGITHVKWSGLNNVECDAANPANCNPAVIHRGGSGVRGSVALMVGASYDITCNLKADLGYRFRHTSGGRMFEFAGAAGPGDHKALKTHEVRTGLRWAIGGKGCGSPAVTYHEPVNPPVYK
ncbi:MAG: outer membrane protein [Rhizobiaceae bacterium]